jgi:hypothetical protein
MSLKRAREKKDSCGGVNVQALGHVCGIEIKKRCVPDYRPTNSIGAEAALRVLGASCACASAGEETCAVREDGPGTRFSEQMVRTVF